ncbi:hypothetical protein F2Q69_00048962 [Brassica cretica]|uniref:Uncharacterized protein n=1 Tax=Brassica cretica TaxID=69181 RepID=A0A8S9PSZ2_BRACR|nr:hypothetical protein F2Q69_00048962 [Brassica cretica]
MERLVKGHRVRNMVQFIMLKTKKLVETYEDKDRTMETEIAMLGETDLFYDRLEEIREYHRKLHLSGHLVDDDDASEDYIALVTKEVPVIAFSEVEGFEKKQGLTFKEMEEEQGIKEEEASRCILKKRNTNGVCVSWESQAQTVLKKSLRLMKQRNCGGG